MTKKKAHPADLADREAVAEATGFNVHLRISPTKKINEEAASLAEAVKIADRIAADHPNRRPLIYALLPGDKTVPVPKDVCEAARQGGSKSARRGLSKPNIPGPVMVQAQAEAVQRQLDAEKAKKAQKKPEGGRKAAGEGKAADKPAKPATGKRAAILEAAKNGVLPSIPDFSAPTHARFRKKLDEIVALVKAGDIDGLKAYPINPISSSPKAMDRYRNLAVTALEARPAASKKGGYDASCTDATLAN